MLSGIFMFAFCLGVTRLTYGDEGSNLTKRIFLPKLKVNLMVNCDALTEGGSSFRHWILPNLFVIGGNSTWKSRNVIVTPENFSLSISRIAKDQLGDYLCYAEGPGGRPFYSRTILDVPPVWETYRLNFVMSLSASGVFVVIATIFCVVSSLRWRQTAPDIAPGEEPLPTKSNGSGGPEEGSKSSRSFEPAAADPKVTTSDVMALGEVTVPGVTRVTRVEVMPPLGTVKPDVDTEDDTAM